MLFALYFPILTLVDVHTKMTKSIPELCVQLVLQVFGAAKSQAVWEL